MGFLDEIIDPIQSNQSDQTETTSRRLNYMISIALISSEEKIKYEMECWKLSEAEARIAIEKLEQYMPIMGHHSIPKSVRQCIEATRLRVERDNFQELRWKK